MSESSATDVGSQPAPIHAVSIKPSSKPRRRSTEQKFRELLRDDKLRKAESLLDTVIVDIDSAPTWQLALKADLHDARREFSQGLECWKRAFAADRNSAQYASECILSLAILNCYRHAFRFYKKLPARLRESKEVRNSLVDVYRWLKWPGHNHKARRKAKTSRPTGLRARVRELFVMLFLKVFVSFERDQRNRLQLSRSSLKYLENIPYRSPEQRYDTYAEVDTALRSLARIQARAHIIGNVLDWLVPAVIIAALSLFSIRTWLAPQNLLLHIMIVLLVGGLAYAVQIGLWRSISGYYRSLALMFAVGIIAFAVAISTPQNSSAALLNSATLQTALFGIAFVSALIPMIILSNGAIHDQLFRRARYRHARGIVLDLLIDAIVAIDTIPARRGQSTGRHHLQRIESIAVILERGVPSQGRSQEPQTDQWLKNVCSKGANALRVAKRRVFASKSGTWDRDVRRTLLQALHAAATENWTALPQRELPERLIQPRSVRIRSLARSVSVAILPAAALAVMAASTDISPSILGWAQIVVVAWAVVCLLLIIDPAIREKINAARDVADTLRGLTSASGGDAATRSAGTIYSKP